MKCGGEEPFPLAGKTSPPSPASALVPAEVARKDLGICLSLGSWTAGGKEQSSSVDCSEGRPGPQARLARCPLGPGWPRGRAVGPACLVTWTTHS